MTSLAAFAAARAADRITLTGRLGLRALPYVAEGVAPTGPPIAGLVVEAVGHAERPGWHASPASMASSPCRLAPAGYWLPTRSGASCRPPSPPWYRTALPSAAGSRPG